MALVTITGNAWTHQGVPIPSNRRPELWFRPNRDNLVGSSLLAGVDVQATLSLATGDFQVTLESDPGLLYRPWMRWLLNPAENDPDRWAHQYAEWPFEILPYPNGGPIENLAQTPPAPGAVLVQLAPPPPGYRGWYLNAPGPGNDPGDPDDPASSGTGILEIVS